MRRVESTKSNYRIVAERTRNNPHSKQSKKTTILLLMTATRNEKH